MSVHSTPLHTQAMQHIQSIQVALTLLDSSFAALKAELTTNTSNIKSISRLAQRVRSIRSAFKRAHFQCFAELVIIGEACRDWLAVADHIENGTKLPDNLEPQLTLAAMTARRSFVAGIIPYSGADEIRQHANHAQTTIEQFIARFRRIEGAGLVALSRKTAEIYSTASICKQLPFKDRKLCKSISNKSTALQRARIERQRALVAQYRKGAKP